MSYRNPQQIVDTQSGQHIQNMLKQVTGAATGAIKTIQAKYRQREKENIAEQQQIIKGVAKVANSANAEDILNSGTDWAPAIREGVARYQELYTKSIKSPLKFSTQDAQEMSSLALMGTQIKQQAIEDQATFDEYSSAFEAGVGQYDGLDKFADPSIYKRINIAGRVGTTPGKSIGTFNWNPKTGGLSTKVTSYNEKGEVVGTNANNTSELPTIANPTKNMEEVEKAIKKKNEDYFKNQKTVSEYNKETGITTKSQYANMDQLIADVRAQSDAYIEGLGTQGAIRLSNNKMLGYMEQVKVPGGVDLGAVGNIIDPEKATWDLDKNGNVSDPQLEQIKIAYAKKLIDDRGLGKDPKILDKVKDKTTLPKKLTAADKLYNDQVELADTSIKDMDELMKTPLKEIGNRKFTMDEQGAFIQVINRHRSKADGKVQTMEDIKADFIREEGKDAWDEENYTAELGYVKESGGKKIIVQLPVGSYEQKTETLVDLLYPNLKTTRRNKMLNIIRGNEGEITLNRSELP
jgi:hypothetical protein